MKTWYLAVLLVACGATETHVAAPSAAAPSVAATQHVPPVVSSSPGPIVVPPRSLIELRQQAQTVREARRAEFEAYEDSVWVDDGADGFRARRRVFVYEDEALSEPGFGTRCRGFSARSDDDSLTLVVDTEREGACVLTNEWSLRGRVSVTGGYRGRCDGVSLMGDYRLVAYSRVEADANHVVYANGAMTHVLGCSSAVREVACLAGGQAYCVVQEPSPHLTTRDPNSMAGRASVAAPPEDDCLVECASNPCEEALGDDRLIGATYSRSSPTLAVFNRRPDCLAYARSRAEAAQVEEEDAASAVEECTDCAEATRPFTATPRVQELSYIRIQSRSVDAETSQWFRLQSMAMDSEAPSAERVDGRVTSIDLHRCIERLVNDQPRNEDGGVRFAATYVATGRVDGGQYFLGPATAVQDVVGADALAEHGRSCFPEQSAAENSEGSTLTYRFSSERE